MKGYLGLRRTKVGIVEKIWIGMLFVMAESIAAFTWLPMLLIMSVGKLFRLTDMGFIEFTKMWFGLEWLSPD